MPRCWFLGVFGVRWRGSGEGAGEPLEPSDYRAVHVGCDTDFEDPEEQSKDERKQSEAGWQKDANDVFTEAGPDKRIGMRVLQARHQQMHVYKMV